MSLHADAALDPEIDPVTDRLAMQIADLTVKAEVGAPRVFAALRVVTAFWLSCVCSRCREEVVQKLVAELPSMLAAAEQADPQPRECRVHH